jgi:uncharacterized protein
MNDHLGDRAATGESDLAALLATLRVTRRPGTFTFVTATVDHQGLVDAAHATVREAEGLTLVVHVDDAEAAGFAVSFEAAWLTLEVHSALEAVGLTAEVSTRLAGAGIACNVIAGTFHDHLLVPVERVDEAMALLDSGDQTAR